mmetsp:Transcript_85112/g.275588  ORF Transcript_85112/g.275588 Transcript_85112/m.275588 type:complete len:106 (+) Transcript_85112:3-320(+)
MFAPSKARLAAAMFRTRSVDPGSTTGSSRREATGEEEPRVAHRRGDEAPSTLVPGRRRGYPRSQPPPTTGRGHREAPPAGGAEWRLSLGMLGAKASHAGPAAPAG